MTSLVREWLPKDAFTAQTVESALAAYIASWSERWFAHARAQISAVRMMGAKPRIAQSLVVQGDFVEVELSGRGKRNLLEAALVTDLSGEVLCEGDHKLLDDFATQIMRDLLSKLDALAAGGEGGVMFALSLSFAGKELGILTIPDHALIPSMKTVMGGARTSSDVPKNCAEGLKPIGLMAQAVLGNAELTLEDLKGLAVGDVVLLDSSLKNAVELKLQGSGQLIGRGRLGRSGDRISIQF